jgi:hypothetical protein
VMFCVGFVNVCGIFIVDRQGRKESCLISRILDHGKPQVTLPEGNRKITSFNRQPVKYRAGNLR